MNTHRTDLPDVVQPRELPGRAVVDALVHAAAGRDVAAHTVRTRTDVNNLRVRLRHRDRADRAERDLVIGKEIPRFTAVRGAHHAPAGHAGVERVRLRRHTGHRGNAAASGMADLPITQPHEEGRVGRGHHGRGRRLRGRLRDGPDGSGRRLGLSAQRETQRDTKRERGAGRRHREEQCSANHLRDHEEGRDRGLQKSYARQRQTLRGAVCDHAGRSTCPAPADSR